MRPARAATPPGPRADGRGGFTLVELLIVTAIVGLVAAIVAPRVQAARERAQVAAAKAEARRASTSIEEYVTLQHVWPEDVGALAAVGFEPSPSIDFCRFELVSGGAQGVHVVIEVAHQASVTAVQTLYPVAGGVLTELDRDASSCGSAGGGGDPGGKGKGKGKGKG